MSDSGCNTCGVNNTEYMQSFIETFATTDGKFVMQSSDEISSEAKKYVSPENIRLRAEARGAPLFSL